MAFPADRLPFYSPSASSSFDAGLSASLSSELERLLKKISTSHFFPAENMRKLLDPYTPAELNRILQDLDNNGRSIFEKTLKCKHYITTAGEPSAGKTTLLESQLTQCFLTCPDLPWPTIPYVYIDSDRCLQNMQQTYARDISLGKPSQEVYDHWKNASEFLTHFFLALALKNGFAIAHGSSLTAPQAIEMLQKIKIIYGYQTTIFHITCNELVRKESEEKRGPIKKYTLIESLTKRAAFFTNLKNYLKYSDLVYFCYRRDLQTSIWAARTYNSEKRIDLYHPEALAEIQKIHDQVVEIGFWEKVFAELGIDF